MDSDESNEELENIRNLDIRQYDLKPKKICTLKELCLNVIKGRPYLFYSMGTAPFYLVCEALKNFSAQDLYTVEQNSYFIRNDHESDSLWKSHCLTEFPALKSQLNSKIINDQDSTFSWRSLYFEKKQELIDKEERIRKLLKSKTAEVNKREESNKTIMIERPLHIGKKKMVNKGILGGALKKAMGTTAYNKFQREYASNINVDAIRINKKSTNLNTINNITQPKLYMTKSRTIEKAKTKNFSTRLLSNGKIMNSPYDNPTYLANLNKVNRLKYTQVPSHSNTTLNSNSNSNQSSSSSTSPSTTRLSNRKFKK